MGKIFNVGSPITFPMPIALDSNLLVIAVQIGNLHNSPSSCQNFFALFDSCAAMNIGNLEIHQCIIIKFSETLFEYIL